MTRIRHCVEKEAKSKKRKDTVEFKKEATRVQDGGPTLTNALTPTWRTFWHLLHARRAYAYCYKIANILQVNPTTSLHPNQARGNPRLELYLV